MVAQVTTFAFHGVEARAVTVQVQLTGGQPAFTIVGLPDKAVSEARERVRAALSAVGLGLPPKRITVNLAPADLPKEGSHFDLAVALGLLIEIGAAPHDAAAGFAVMGELGLDGSIAPVAGALPAAVACKRHGAWPDLPGGKRSGSRPGRGRGGNHCAEIAYSAGQSLQGNASPLPCKTWRTGKSGGHTGPYRRQGPGNRQTRARSRRSRRS